MFSVMILFSGGGGRLVGWAQSGPAALVVASGYLVRGCHVAIVSDGMTSAYRVVGGTVLRTQ